MTEKYKLTYFNVPALAEPTRFLLHYGQIDFEDIRIEPEDWPSVKKETPYGKLPVLEYRGKKVGESSAINRYIAKIIKLTGNDEWEDLVIDSVVDLIVDLRTKIVSWKREKNEEWKKSLEKELFDKIIPDTLQILEDLAAKNNGYLAVGKLTWADIFLIGNNENFKIKTGKNLLENYPNLSKLNAEILAKPSIKSYLENRPKSTIQ